MEVIADYTRLTHYHYKIFNRENPIYFLENKLENCKDIQMEAEWEFKSNLQHYDLIK